MNFNQAKSISIVDFLEKEGIHPEYTKGHKYFYLSPFRDEEKASFKVDTIINKYYDFGENKGGSIIDLVIRLYKVTANETLSIIESKNASIIPPFKNDAEPYFKTEVSEIENIDIKPLKHYVLLMYLRSRHIKTKLVESYLNEVHYTLKSNTKTYYAICFKSNSGGCETRNKFFKGCLINKDISTIKGLNPELKTVSIFEGFMDFCSWITLNEITLLNEDIIVLNGIGQKDKAINEIQNQGYEIINLFLDNDTPGFNTSNSIINIFPFAVNQSCKKFPNDKDFNEYLTRTRTEGTKRDYEFIDRWR